MLIGLPKEVKDNEFRVGMTPAAVRTLTHHGHRVRVESGAGMGSSFSDQEYHKAGAEIVEGCEAVWSAELVIKVKEPVVSEHALLRPGLLLFTFLHLASNKILTEALLNSGTTAIAYETVQSASGQLPLLTPMSEVAGRMAPQVGATYLMKSHGGRGVLMSGVPGVSPASVVVLGGGIVGSNAARIAVGYGAQVTVLDVSHDRLKALDDLYRGQIETRFSDRHTIEEVIAAADLIIGAVLIPGARAPWLISADMLPNLRKGAVIVDVAVDQGGCVETSRPTTHSDPVYEVDGIVHYCVANMPGAVPRTSTMALSNQTVPYILKLADEGINALRQDPALQSGLNIHQGKITHEALAESLNMTHVDASTALN